MGQVKSAFHDTVAQQSESELGADEPSNYAPIAPISPSMEIYLLMDCSVPVSAYMYKALAVRDMDIFILAAEFEEYPDLHDYWVKSMPMALVAE